MDPKTETDERSQDESETPPYEPETITVNKHLLAQRLQDFDGICAAVLWLVQEGYALAGDDEEMRQKVHDAHLQLLTAARKALADLARDLGINIIQKEYMGN